MTEFIPLSVPNLKGNELKYVTEAVEKEWVSTGGEMITQFESEFAKYLGVEAATACQSGTAGIHLALMLAGVGSGDEVIVPTLTFIAAVNPVRYVNADPIFMDCDDSLCMDSNKLEDFCANRCEMADGRLINKETKKHIKAVVVVHVFGNMADMQSIISIANRYNLIIIEDATEALGTFYKEGIFKGKFAGTIGDYGVYSFNGNKIITTGGGGMLVSKYTDMVKRAKYLSTQAKDDVVNFIHNEIGYNYRMTNLQAALGVAQLEQLENFINVKTKNYHLYCDELNSINSARILPFRDNIRPNYWFYSLVLNNYCRDDMIKYLCDNNIQTRPIWGLIHEQKPYKNCYSYRIEKAIEYYNNIINIPCSTNLVESQVYYVSEFIKRFCQEKIS